MPNQPPQNYSGQNLTQTIMVNGAVVTNPQIAIPREPFLLERYYFDKLIKGDSVFDIGKYNSQSCNWPFHKYVS
jgi:hypothetical protein